MKPFKGELHHWRKYNGLEGQHIVAFPRGHPNFRDWIITSPVVHMNEETGDLETLNSLYKLVGPCQGTVAGKISKSDFVGDTSYK